MSTVELDQYTQQALDAYLVATKDADEATERRAKARDTLVTFLKVHGADRGEIDGRHAVTLTSDDRLSLDSTRLKAEHPEIFRLFTKRVPYERLSVPRFRRA